MQYQTGSAEETQEVARELLQHIVEENQGVGSAPVIGLSGDLGAGKTTFMKGIAQALGIEEDITSPTFIIEKIYDLTDQPFDRLVHIDAYRLESGDELVALGWYEVLSNPRTIVFIEWPEQVSEVMPDRTQYIRFEVPDETTRILYVNEPLEDEQEHEEEQTVQHIYVKENNEENA